MITVKRREETLIDDIEEAERAAKHRELEAKDAEMRAMEEIGELRKQINQKLVEHAQSEADVEELLSQVNKLESEILEKKMSIAGIEKDLLDANLEQFRVMPTDCF